MIRLQVNTTEVIGAFNRAARFDKRAFHSEVAIYLQSSIRRGVTEERDVRGIRFARLAPRTINAKRGGTIRGSAHILRDTNSMMKAIVARGDTQQATVRFGDRLNAQKARWHNLGTRWMPRREFFGIRRYAGHNDVEFIEQRIAPRYLLRDV